MPPISLAPLSGRYLSFAEREEIAILRGPGLGVREIARRLGPGPVDDLAGAAPQRRDPRRAPGVSGHDRAVACRAGAPSARRSPSSLPTTRLREYVQERLAGEITAPDGRRCRARRCGGSVGGTARRQDRRWAKSWSPEQISHRLRVDFPDDESMRISHEAIYQALYVQGRGALRRELVACLRTGRALRVPPGAHPRRAARSSSARRS